MKPDLIWRCRGDRAEINRKARFDVDSFEPLSGPVLDSLRALIEECRFELPEGLPPMASCLLGYMGYDTVRLMEKLPAENPASLDVPDGLFLRPTIVAVFDRVEDLVTVFTPVWPRTDVAPRAAYAQACERLADVAQDFERALPQRRDVTANLDDLPAPAANMSQDDFQAMVLKAKDYILSGVIFQVVLSQRLSLPF
jgi:anthranilate synthase component 1